MTPDEAQKKAWSDYWSGKSGDGQGGGCLPRALAEIHAAQAEVWHAFARAMPRKARMLDLASGDGAVMRYMLAVRRDLKPMGVDSANGLPPPPDGAKLKPGMNIEALPFNNGSFDGITSQFGIEYSDTQPSSAEVARLLKPEGRFAAIIHRADGPILAHNLPRRAGLQWVLDQNDLIGKARNYVRSRAMLRAPVPPLFHEKPTQAELEFGTASTAWELSQAIYNTLYGGQHRPNAQVLSILQELEIKAQNEIGRITALENAVRSETQFSELCDIIKGHGLQIARAGPISRFVQSSDFAWLIEAFRT